MRKGSASTPDGWTCGARLASLIGGRGLVALAFATNGLSTGRCAERRLVEVTDAHSCTHTWLDCSLTCQLLAEASWQHSCDLSPLGPQTKLPHNYSLQMVPTPNDSRGLFVCQSVAGQEQHAFLKHMSFHNFSLTINLTYSRVLFPLFLPVECGLRWGIPGTWTNPLPGQWQPLQPAVGWDFENKDKMTL